MKFIALKKHIEENNPQPFYVVMGDDGYLIKKATNMLTGLADGMTEFNVHIFSESVKAADIVATCQTIPLLGDRIVVIVHNFSGDANEVIKYLKKPLKETVLVFVLEKLSKGLAELVRLATIVECDRLDAVSLQKWIIKRCEQFNSGITLEAAALLVTYCDRFMARIEIETEKLCAYRINDSIRVSDVEEMVAASLDFKTYELCDAIVEGKKEKALTMLNSLLESNPAGYLLASLYSYFRRLLYATICKDAETAEYLGVKEFAVSMARKTAASIGAKRIKEICDRLQEVDFDFKSGRINDKLALRTFVSLLVWELSSDK